MDLQDKLKESLKDQRTPPVVGVINHDLTHEFAKIASFTSTKAFEKSTLFKSIGNDLNRVLCSYEYGHFGDESVTLKKPFIRAILWHLEQGVNYKGILDALRNRPILNEADVFFFPGVDLGMARSDNQNVARDLAIELGYHYVFVPSFFHFKTDANNQTQDRLGLEGAAILSRFPVETVDVVELPRIRDGLRSSQKSYGNDKLLIVELRTPQGFLQTACLNLSTRLSQKERAKQIKAMCTAIPKDRLADAFLLGADLKTSTYNMKSGFHFLLSAINKAYRGFDYICSDHHPHPEVFFDKRVFEALASLGLSYETVNPMGVGSFHIPFMELFPFFESEQKSKATVQKIIKSSETLNFKYDWFFANHALKVSQNHQAEKPKVISHLFHEGQAISHHDPVLLDFEIQDA